MGFCRASYCRGGLMGLMFVECSFFDLAMTFMKRLQTIHLVQLWSSIVKICQDSSGHNGSGCEEPSMLPCQPLTTLLRLGTWMDGMDSPKFINKQFSTRLFFGTFELPGIYLYDSICKAYEALVPCSRLVLESAGPSPGWEIASSAIESR